MVTSRLDRYIVAEMRALFAPVVWIPLIAAGIAAWLVPVTFWSGIRATLLPALSIIAAAVLVRLARGIPFANPDHFTLDEFRAASLRLESNARKLRALIFVCLGAIVLLVIVPAGSSYVHAHSVLPGWALSAADKALAALLAWSVTYSLCRTVEVVHSDVALLKLQAKVIETAIARKNAAGFEAKIGSQPPPQIAGAERFGMPLQ
jgi:hypothetical protein